MYPRGLFATEIKPHLRALPNVILIILTVLILSPESKFSFFLVNVSFKVILLWKQKKIFTQWGRWMIGWQNKCFLNAHYTSIGIGCLIVSYRLQSSGHTVAVFTLLQERPLEPTARAGKQHMAWEKKKKKEKEKKEQQQKKNSCTFWPAADTDSADSCAQNMTGG